MLLSQKFKNAIVKKTGLTNLEFRLNNTLVNGQKRGCSGFIYNPDTDVYVYVNTEPSCYKDMTFCRYAKDFKDYTGGFNNNCYSEEELIKKTAVLVTSVPNDRKIDTMAATADALQKTNSYEWETIARMATGISA